MGERKVLNKYYPPDFDPSKLPRGKRPKNDQVKVRMMMPMSVRCNTCGEYIYKGKKFNARKETVIGEEYLGIKIFRFYMRCVRCSAEFTIKTDPKNSDYVAEIGVSRNFEPWREKEKIIEEAKRKRQEEEEGDAMKALENKTLDSKIEMDIIEGLAEIRALNALNEKINPEIIFQHHKRTHEESILDEEELELKNVIFKNSPNYIKRIEQKDDDDDDSLQENKNEKLKNDNNLLLSKKDEHIIKKSISKPLIQVIKKIKNNNNEQENNKQENNNEENIIPLVDY